MPTHHRNAVRAHISRVSDVLSRWAGARRLDASQSTAIRQAVLAAPPDLGFEWWWRLLDPEHGSATRAWTLPTVPAMRSSMAPNPLPRLTPSMMEQTTWAHDDVSEYLPYLRLT